MDNASFWNGGGQEPQPSRRQFAHRVSEKTALQEPPPAEQQGGMPWSGRVGRFAGIDVYIHATFLILIGWLLMVFLGMGSTPVQTFLGIVFVMALFVCVVLHEFGHALMARRYGVKTRDITLLPIGGVARLERIPSEPWQELLVALAGPAVNVVIAGVLLAVLWLAGLPLRGLDAPLLGTGRNPLADLMYVNLALVVFNMLPAFPMDGGRVLRALLAMWISRVRATRIASLLGQGMAILFALLGLMGQPFLLFIALFVYLGAVQEYHTIRWEAAVEGLTARDAMLTSFRTLLTADPLSRAVTLLLQGAQHDFPVLDDNFRVVGFLLRQDLIAHLGKDGGSGLTVARAMRPVSREASAPPDEPLVQSFERMQSQQLPILPVFDAAGKLLGLLTMENVAEVVMVKNALERAQAERGLLQAGAERIGVASSQRRKRDDHLEDMETSRQQPAER